MIVLHFICPTCGQVEVDGLGVTLHVAEDSLSYFSLACPQCGSMMGGKIPTRMAEILRELGLESSNLPFCMELLEPRNGPDEPFTDSDLQEFRALLDRPDAADIARKISEPGEN